MTKRPWNEAQPNPNSDDAASLDRPRELHPYEEDDTPTLPWSPAGDRSPPGQR